MAFGQNGLFREKYFLKTDFHGQARPMKEHGVHDRYDFVDVLESRVVVDFRVQVDVLAVLLALKKKTTRTGRVSVTVFRIRKNGRQKYYPRTDEIFHIIYVDRVPGSGNHDGVDS